jgi:hypothetical protein
LFPCRNCCLPCVPDFSQTHETASDRPAFEEDEHPIASGNLSNRDSSRLVLRRSLGVQNKFAIVQFADVFDLLLPVGILDGQFVLAGIGQLAESSLVEEFGVVNIDRQ